MTHSLGTGSPGYELSFVSRYRVAWFRAGGEWSQDRGFTPPWGCVCVGIRLQYPYTAQLKELERRKASGQVTPSWLQGVHTPLVLGAWRESLAAHPDTDYREYVLRGIQQGFRIGFRHGDRSCKSAKANMKSATDNPGVVDEYLAKEVRLGRVLGPLEAARLPSATSNRFGVIPKPHQPGKWRLIVPTQRGSR